MGVLRKKKTKGRPAAVPQPNNEGKQLTGSKMSLTPSLDSASLELEQEEEAKDRVNLLLALSIYCTPSSLLYPKFCEVTHGNALV